MPESSPPAPTLPADLGELVARCRALPAAELVEALRADQARRWRSGQRLPAEAYLSAFPVLAASPEDALVMIWGEALLRFESGEAPRPEEYRARFPQYADALALQFELQAHLETPSASRTLVRPESPGAATPAWPTVPGYEILGELGRGGMGVVYRARQGSLNRVVALKMLLAGPYAGPQERGRFRAEAEAVARLRHPNVVQIFEIGEQAGRPYLVLEYVEGGSLDAALEGTPQNPRAAAALVETLARAVHAAHAAGVVHRDLKPANVLLASGGCEPPGEEQPGGLRPPLAECVPKITDFGLAKLLGAGTGRTPSDAILGTPSYMAPEQASGKARSVGPAADTYALGAILYEMLTGRPPFRGETPLDTLQQVVLEDAVAPRALQPKVPADLETVCQKCLEKESAKRYADAAALADDLRRFLAGEPIRARPVGPAARFYRWCRRKPAPAGLLALLVAGTAISTWQAVAATRARADADRQREAAEARLDLASGAVGTYLNAVTDDEDLRKSDFHPLRKRLLESAIPFYRRLAEERPGDARQEAARERAFGRLAAVYNETGAHEQALEAVDERIALVRRREDGPPGETGPRGELALAYLQRGAVLRQLARLDEARQACQEAVRLCEQAARGKGDDPQVLGDLADAQNSLGVVLKSQSDFAGAAKLFAEAEGSYARCAGGTAQGGNPERRAMALTNLGEALSRSGNLPGAREALEKARDLRRDLLKLSPQSAERRRALAATCNSAGNLLGKMRDWAAARAAHEEALALRAALAADFPSRPDDLQEAAASHNNLGGALLALKDRDGARKHFEASHQIKQKLARDFPRKPVYQQDLAVSYNNLGAFLIEGGEKAAARQSFEEALRVREGLAAAFPRVPDYRKDVVASRCNLGQTLEKLGDGAAALRAYRKAAEAADDLVKNSPGAAAHHALQGLAHLLVAERLSQEEKYAEALPEYDRAVDVLARTPPVGEINGREQLRNAYINRAEVLYRFNQDPKAEEDWKQALALSPPAERWAVAYGRATSLWRTGRFASAAAAVEELVKSPETTATRDYDGACVLALIATDVKDSAADPGARERYAARCVELLRSAHAKGLFRDPGERERFRTNPDFDALRTREDFRRLQVELTERPGPQP